MTIDADDADTGSVTSPYNDKLLLASFVSLSVVIFFVVLLHLYARYLLLLRHRRQHLPSLALRLVLQTEPPSPYLNYDGDHYVVPGHVTETRPTVGGGVDPKVAASLPEFVYRAAEHSGIGVECVVCLSVMEEGERGRRLPQCDHAFHVWCIDVWFTAHDTCPICRAPVRMEEAPLAAEVEVEEVEMANVDSVVVEAGEMAVVEVEKDEESSSSASNNLSFGSSLLRILSRGRS